jgi:hypothetical protein
MKLPTPLYIAVCAIVALSVAIWWESNGAKTQFAGINFKIPDFDQSFSSQSGIFGNQTQNNNTLEKFIFPDGNLSFKYPSDYKGAENLFGQDAPGKLKSNNILLFSYRMTIPDLQPAYIIALESDATTTEAAAERFKGAFAQQQCTVDIKNATSTNAIIYQVLDADYNCSAAQPGYNQWHAQAALIRKDLGFYTVAAVSTAKNWPSFENQVQTIFNSIAAKPVPGTANKTASTTATGTTAPIAK